jgi:hypothetical protein
MRKLRIALCAALIAVAASACGDPGGGSEASPQSLEVLAAAADKVSDAGSSAMTMTMTMDVDGDEVTAEGEGVFAWIEETGEMTVTMSGSGRPGEGEMDLIIDGDDVYMKMPPELGAGAGWYRMDASGVGSGVGGANQLSQDPSQFVEFLRGASEDGVQDLGTEEVRGVSTHHYKAEISFEKMLDQARDQEAVEAMRAQLEAFGDVDSFPMEVWIDEDGLPRRMDVVMDMADIGAMDASIEMFDYGVEVDVRPPRKFQELPGSAG